MKYDILFIGGGPGGYVGAMRAAQMGLKTALIEKDKVGGTCLMRGCIPTKTLINHAEVVRTIRSAENFGVHVSDFSFDYEKMKRRKDEVVTELWQGVRGLLKANGVDVYEGVGSFVSNTEVKVKGEKCEILEAERIVIGTGSIPMQLDFCPVDCHRIHDSTSILEITKLPKKLMILGAGYIGCEFASLFSALGVEVTMIEFLPGIVWQQGKAISQFLTKVFKESNITLLTDIKMESCESTSEKVIATLSDSSKVEADMLLVSVGRSPYTESLELGKAGLTTNDKGFIEVNNHMQTAVKNIYAIGDVTGKVMLAHVASHQAIVAAEHAAGKNAKMDYDAIPAVIFTHPEIATVGISIETAKERGISANTATFPFSALGKAKAAGEENGYVEIVFDADTHQIIGASALGVDASNLIGEMGVAIQNELTLECVAETIHAHPTIAEAWLEGANLAIHHPIHLPPGGK